MPLLEELRQAVANDQRSQREIAKLAGIHFVSLSRFMTRASDLSVEAAERLATALGWEAGLKKPKKKRK